MSASHVKWDEDTRATYLDMVITSVGRVTLSGPEGKIPTPGPKIEGITDHVWRVTWWPPLSGKIGWMNLPATAVERVDILMTATGQKNHDAIGW